MSARYTEEWLANRLAKQGAAKGPINSIGPEPSVITGKSYSFTVFGEPQPAGSKQAFPLLERPRRICHCGVIPGPTPLRRWNGAIVINVTDDNKDTKAWRNRVSQTAREEYAGPLMTGFVSLECVFYLPRPKSHYGSGVNEHRVKPSAPAMPGVKPDHDKLLRAVSDGLTQAGNVYTDDALVVDGIARKRYGSPPRVEITIAEIVVPDPYEQPALFEVEDDRPPWEIEVSAGDRQKASEDRPDLVSAVIDPKDMCDGGTSHNGQSGETAAPPPWEVQEQETAVTKKKRSRGKVIA